MIRALKLLLIAVLLVNAIIVYGGGNYIVYVYGDIHCPHCAALKEFIIENYGREHLYFCDIGSNRTCTLKFYNIVQAFGIQPGIPLSAVIVDGKVTGVVFGELPVKSVWDKLIQPADLDSRIPIYAMTTNGTPAIIGYIEMSQEALAYFFIHGELPPTNTTTTTATITNTTQATLTTTTNTSTVTQITSTLTSTITTTSSLATTTTTTTTRTSSTTITATVLSTETTTSQQTTNTNSSTITQITHSKTNTQTMITTTTPSSTATTITVIKPSTNTSKSLDFLTALSLTVSLSLADSVNPCTIYLYTILLIAASIASIGVERRVNYRRVVAVGLAFALAVLMGYLLLGLGLITFVSSLPKIFFTAVGVGFGLWVIYSALTGRERVAAKKSMVRLLPKASKSLLFSFALGLLATFTLLPCSAGPYIVFAGIASKLSMIQAAILLVIYNLVFISPLIIVLMAILLGVSRQSVRDFLIKYNRVLSIIAGLLLIAIALYASFI